MNTPVTLFLGINVQDYIDNYELRADEGDYSPNDTERLLIADAVHGVIAEIEEAAGNMYTLSPGMGLVLKERERQIVEKGFSAEKDDQYKDNELARAAACYAAGMLLDGYLLDDSAGADLFPWDDTWRNKMYETPRLRQLIIAGALIAAEIDRRLRDGESV